MTVFWWIYIAAGVSMMLNRKMEVRSMIDKNIGGFQFIAGRWPLDPGKPTVVFIHGAANSRMFWKAQVGGLSAGANTVAPDLPGHGMSGGEGRDSVAGYAAAVRDFISAIGADRPVVCGLSMGGAIALHLLIDLGRECRAGIIINSGARLKVLPAIFDMIRNDYRAFCGSLAKFAASPETDPTLLADAVAETEKCDPSVAYDDFSACNSFDMMNGLDAIAVPVLVIASADDILSPPKYAQYLKDRIPGSKIVTVQAAGHMSPVEKPGEINDAIRNFLASIPV